ncbi:MAG: molecular chaperone DnaJ [Leptospiraceae bacterium]|nr:molecular chaperone DnaJ [Leptospiraceae bacterium]MCK6380332.1 molecular chaperone DnaJ [Leptospiraceae bacterium]NUM41753.1 molecular chaperone DnaJ [Leptospiraceae bacterium]
MNENNKAEATLFDIITEIQSISVEGKWFLSSTRLSELLEIRKEIYYRMVYSANNPLLNYDVLGGFHETDCEVLCKFLSNFLGIENTEKVFMEGGLYFSKETLDEIVEYFFRYLTASVESHKLDKELILLLSSATLKFDDAFDSYIDEKFDKEIMIDRYVSYYVEIKHIDISYGADSFLKKYLLSLYSDKKIDMQKISREAKERAYYEVYGRDIRLQTHNKETLSLIQFFQLDENSNRTDLRKKYKELLKKYHPDLNKFGLEKTKEVIENYKKLSAILK